MTKALESVSPEENEPGTATAGEVARRRPGASVDSSTRVMVAFPFSHVHVGESHGAAQVAELLARVCRAIVDGGSPDELRELGAEAEDLASRLRRH